MTPEARPLSPTASPTVRLCRALREVDRLLSAGARLGLCVRTAATKHHIDPVVLAELVVEKATARLEAQWVLLRLDEAAKRKNAAEPVA